MVLNSSAARGATAPHPGMKSMQNTFFSTLRSIFALKAKTTPIGLKSVTASTLNLKKIRLKNPFQPGRRLYFWFLFNFGHTTGPNLMKTFFWGGLYLISRTKSFQYSKASLTQATTVARLNFLKVRDKKSSFSQTATVRILSFRHFCT